MQMTEKEICKSYRRAENKRAQIGILAELNATSKEFIKEILERGGEMGRPRLKAEAPKKTIINEDFAAAVDDMTGKRVPMPDIVKDAIQFGIDALDVKITELEAEYKATGEQLKELREKKRSIEEYMKRPI